MFSLCGHETTLVLSICWCHRVLVAPSQQASPTEWQSLDWRDTGTWGFYFPSRLLLQQLTDKVKLSSRLSLPPPDSRSSGKRTLDNPPAPGTHRHQLILHHRFSYLPPPGADFSGCDQPPREPCNSTSASQASKTKCLRSR